ncbi:hypothetical protein HK103_002776 [Boothiomyces macroporosus]|uniref:Uncharacterized protein n=1 Tax=Boothiomyces macroporosus TaxID=261099 RepID=A0AAD5Y6J9_9FUNG|nr:hypothetical protein HK103_002749 [Boothiomyces macroporosus]KAJ3262361.1 hypothetical protein HK103_002776 [Boothiomyces macroporosus]
MSLKREIHRITVKPNYDYTAAQILILPAYNQLYSHDPLTRYYPDCEPNGFTAVGVDFLYRDFDYLDLAQTFKFTRQRLIPLACGVARERLENVLIRKFNQTFRRLGLFNPLQDNSSLTFTWAELDATICGTLYIKPTCSINASCKKESSINFKKLSIGPDWFNLLKLCSQLCGPERTKLLDRLKNVLLNPPNYLPLSRKYKKKSILHSDPTVKSNILKIKRSFKDSGSSVEFVESKNMLEPKSLNVQFDKYGKLLHEYGSKVGFNWKVEQRNIVETDTYSGLSPVKETLLKIDTLGNKSIYYLPSFMQVTEKMVQEMLKLIPEYMPLFIQPQGIFSKPNKLADRKADLLKDTLPLPMPAPNSYTPYVLTDSMIYQNPSSSQEVDIIDMVAQRNKTVLEMGHGFFELVKDVLNLGKLW